jgi:ribonuclease D
MTIDYIDNAEQLANCVHELSSVKELAFDLEFDSHRNAYGFNLCLMQVATADACYIIDPLSKIDLSNLFRLFEDERILKVVHSPGEDLRLLHSLKCYPKNIFDTEIAARLLNYEFTSLSAMLEVKIGFNADKKQQKSNWITRPLSEQQIQYAANDVIYLLQLKNLLEQEAQQKKVSDFLQEEFELLSSTIYIPEPKQNFLRTADIKGLNEYDQFVLNELFKFRDTLAQSINKPAYQVIDEDLLRNLVSKKINLNDWLHVKGVNHRYKTEEFKEKLTQKLEAINQEATQKKLSKTAKTRTANFLTEEERTSRQQLKEQQEFDKQHKFIPIQKAIEQEYGEHTAKYILGNGAVNELLKKSIKIGQLKRAYKTVIVSAIAAELAIDLKDYF